jgi:hypothetical protein
MEVLIPLAFFGFLAAIILVPIWLREKTRQSAHQVLSQALERGQTLDPALMRELTEANRRSGPKPDQPRRTLGSGIVLGALALGFVGANYFSEGDFDGGMMIAAVILGALAVAFLLLATVDYMTKRKEQ